MRIPDRWIPHGPLQPGDIEAARRLVSDLCQRGDRAWCMCVPVQEGDSDVLLTRVIDAAEQGEQDRQDAERFRTLVRLLSAPCTQVVMDGGTLIDLTAYELDYGGRFQRVAVVEDATSLADALDQVIRGEAQTEPTVFTFPEEADHE